MYTSKASIDEINKYFGTTYTARINSYIYDIEELMRLVWRISELGFVVNIQDLNSIDKPHDFRIWFNYRHETHGLVECPFGQIAQSSAVGILEGNSLSYCLLYSIGEWCKYNKLYDCEIIWRRNRGFDGVMRTGSLAVGDKQHLLYRIHDTDHFYLEYRDFDGTHVMSEMPDDMDYDDIKLQAQLMFFSRITYITDDISRYILE